MYDNHITSVPDTIANLTSLGEFNLSNNALASLPESFTQLSSLNYININSNAICPYALSSNLRDLLDQYNEQDDGDWRNIQDKSACDSDNDSIMDPGDNCPLVANTNQAD